MKINYDKLNKKFWFEDANGNEIDKEQIKDGEIAYYRKCFPLEIHDMIYEYCYHPKNPINMFLCRKSKRFYRWISKYKERTFINIHTTTTTYGSGDDCIVAMVNSGDFTLEQAVWVYANSCERCMNVLAYKYLDGKDGYPEYSVEWKKCNTVCEFCEDEK